MSGIGHKIADVAAQAVDRTKELADKVLSSARTPRQHVSDAIGRLQTAHRQFAEACRDLKSVHFEEVELVAGWETLARWSDESVASLEPSAERYGNQEPDAAKELRKTLFPHARPGPVGVLEDLHALVVLAANSQAAGTLLQQAAMALRDEELLGTIFRLDEQVKRQQAWLLTHLKHRAPHTLTVPA